MMAGAPGEQNSMHASISRNGAHLPVATVLDKELKRQITLDGEVYTVALDPQGIRLTGKGKRKPEVELRWRDLLSGEAAMAVALNASLSKEQKRDAEPVAPRDRTNAPAPKRRKP
jgi:hypothetical protein